MKLFSNLQQLWSYSLFCPICRDVCRDLLVNLGPEEIWKDTNSSKLENILTISGDLHFFKDLYSVRIPINCSTNKFEIFFSEKRKVEELVEKAGHPYLFFHVESDCKKCHGAWTVSTDIELNLMTNEVTNVGLELEEVWIPKYVISYNYMKNKMEIDKTEWVEDENGAYETSANKKIALPLYQFDFSDVEKTTQKIKTMITFS